MSTDTTEVPFEQIESSVRPGKPHGGYWVAQGGGTTKWLTKINPGAPMHLDLSVPAPHNNTLTVNFHGPDVPKYVQSLAQ
eukprot:CAMPEP_0174734636 /NCGR_PEP_ID=MMETSP1094-20130205/63669_1 /TAXON_ID=156173 /ORGANISM="Chrysochromulina brevifilum, Strain UTEX LB 985" /LENGTH=79 /DNA_ID=CAMNT_0015937481 /DNA_START=75 /DNA_END=314 /DNA_ORIENTATION=-